ncbi:DUF447 family protein [Methanobrevibacter sp. TMH8]|uniref:DUF447 domain-containing protein n=1 Tax=Methanobrevibacter sp. TMH8 TaxID=2848611 RepID=UPI001CCA7C44|nr:DUF447 domain-containing protein [Methanobrevibacter sp. TMH8]MBZ9571471.1 DUF447 family protein [Methanobrevibacter sp. TMH8]
MNIDLSSVGMEKGQQYETIITTINKDKDKNAAPIGVICKDKDKIMCRIFEGSTTLDNIINQKEFIVNITLDPILFTLATTGNIPEDLFDKSNISDSDSLVNLKNTDAYLKCKVIKIKDAIKKSDPIRKSEAKVIISDVVDIVLNNKCTKAANRGFYSLVESLVNFTRIDIVDKEKKDYFLDRFLESKRIINKVGSKEDKLAMDLLKKALEDKGYSINND